MSVFRYRDMNIRDFLMETADRVRFERFRSYLNPNVYPTNIWYREHLERNFDFVNLGGILARHDFGCPLRHEKRMNWGLKGQTLKQSFSVLKNFFSILKPGGTAFFPFYSYGELMYGWRDVQDIRPYLFDMQAYWLTRSHFRILIMKVAKHIPLLLVWPKDVVAYISKLFHKDYCGYLIKSEYDFYAEYRCTENDFARTKSLIAGICSFCEERNIKAVFIKMPIAGKIEDATDVSSLIPIQNYLDLSVDNGFSLFESDGIRLNEKGRILFIQKLVSQCLKS